MGQMKIKRGGDRLHQRLLHLLSHEISNRLRANGGVARGLTISHLLRVLRLSLVRFARVQNNSLVRWCGAE